MPLPLLIGAVVVGGLIQAGAGLYMQHRAMEQQREQMEAMQRHQEQQRREAQELMQRMRQEEAQRTQQFFTYLAQQDGLASLGPFAQYCAPGGVPGGQFAFAQGGYQGAPYPHQCHCHCHPQQFTPPRCGHPGGPQHNPGGRLEQECQGKPITYTTSGGYRVTINKDNVTVTDPSGKNTVTHSGDPHEYVNGQHIKDWDGKTRTLILDDGTKITMGASGPHGVVTSTSVYDGAQSFQVNNNNNEITSHTFNPWETQMRERAQADGETSVIARDGRGGINYFSIYNQNENLGVTPCYRDLASVNRPPCGGPPRVRDLFDDPRLAHT